jgi:hypothetical protein
MLRIPGVNVNFIRGEILKMKAAVENSRQIGFFDKSLITDEVRPRPASASSSGSPPPPQRRVRKPTRNQTLRLTLCLASAKNVYTPPPLSLMPTVIGSTFAASLRTDISPHRKEAHPRLTL